MTGRVFVDSNVLVYARDKSQPDKLRRAREWMAHLWRTGQGAVSYQVLQEFYAVCTRKLKVNPADAQAEIRDLLGWRPLSVDPELFEKAWSLEERYGLSCWDALIVAAAQRAACPVLLTEDLQDGQDLGGVRVVNPFQTAPV